MGEMISSLSGGEANYAIIGCGVEGRGMGWYHALQLLNGEIPRARRRSRLPAAAGGP